MKRIFNGYLSEDDMISDIIRCYPDIDERRRAVNIPRKGGFTLLTYALSHKDFKGKLVHFLLQSGADPNWITKSGTHTLWFNNYIDETITLYNMRLLLAYGSDPNRPGQARSVLYGHVRDTIAIRGSVICPMQGSAIHLLLIHGAQMDDRDARDLRGGKGMKIVANFYNNVSLRQIALHRIRLDQLRSQ